MGTGDLEPWVVESEKVALRGTPSVNGKLISFLGRGDQFNVAELVCVQNEDWVRLPKGTAVVKEKASSTLEMKEDGYVLIRHPQFGTLAKKRDGVAVQEEKQEGYLSKEVMQKILAKSSNAKELIIPLEAKTWTAAEFDLFVMSGGVVRPKWCSVPDMNDMVNNNMKDHEVDSALRQAAEWLAGADAVLVGSGAGMGVDSGLSTFRGGKAGVWPALEIVGLAYEEICDPKWFKKEPALAWAFWNFCHEAYQATKPHRGYELVRNWAAKAPLGAFSFTSNIDSHWAASGWSKRRIIEVHGCVAWHQCAQACCPDVWEAPTNLGLTENPSTHRVDGDLPKCPKCGMVARPCVQMFGGDSGFAKSRRAVQINRYDAWLKKMEARPDAQQLRVVCLELGCGLTVPTVRRELEAVLGRFKNARLVRVNPENPGLSKELQNVGLSLPLAAGVALSSLEPQVTEILKAPKEMANFILWDLQGGGIEVTAPLATPLMRLVRLAEAEEGVEVEFNGKPVTFHANNLLQLNLKQDLGPEDTVPRSFLWNMNKRAEKANEGDQETVGPDGEPLKTVVISCHNMTFKNGMSQRLEPKVAEVSQMLDSMNELFETKEYQDELVTKVDRRGVLQLVRYVHLQVLPNFGITANDTGVWLMQVLTGMAMAGRGEISLKANRSMEVSGVHWASTLPALVKAEKPKQGHQANSVQEPEKVEKAPPPPPEPLEVTLRQLSEDEQAASLKLEVMTDTLVAELRERFAARLGLKEAKLKQVKFLMKTGGSFATMKEHEPVRKEVFVVGLDKWVHPDEEPPFEVEMMVRNALVEEDEVKFTAMSNHTLGQVKEALFQQLGRPELGRKARFAKKTGNAFSGSEDSERLGYRQVLLVMGLGEDRLKASEPAEAGQTQGGASASSSKKALKDPPDLTLEEAVSLQRDLIEGFRMDDFQKRLSEINRSQHTGQLSKGRANMERHKLFLTVQKEVLPKYGLEGSPKGVFDMMNIFQTKNFEQFEEFGQNGVVLNELLMGNFERERAEADQHTSSSSSSQPSRSSSGKMLVKAISADYPDATAELHLHPAHCIYNLKVELQREHNISRAHYFTYLKKNRDGTYKVMEDRDRVEERVWAHDYLKEYLPDFLPPGQRQKPPGGTPSRPLEVGGTGHWPPGSELYQKLEEQQMSENPAFLMWMLHSFKTMEPREATAWLSLDEDQRWLSLLWMIKTPFFRKCRTIQHFYDQVFTLPGEKAPYRFLREDPELSKVENQDFYTRWFEAAGDDLELTLVTVFRLGDDELVGWDVVLTKNATVTDLRHKLKDVLGLQDKAAKQMRFAMQKGTQSYLSMTDSEKVKRVMAVRGLEGVWPPPVDPAAAHFPRPLWPSVSALSGL